MAASDNKIFNKYDEYREWLLALKTYPEKPLNSRLRCIVNAIPEGSTVLDVACGTGRVLQAALAKGCRGRGIEISQPAVEAARLKELDVMEGDVDSWNENPKVADLLFDVYDVVVFSKCLMYLRTKNEILERLKTRSIVIFQGNPGSLRSRFSGEAQDIMNWNKQLPYRRKDGTEVSINGVGPLASWAASYGYRKKEVFYGGLWAKSLVVRFSRTD
jgi:methionine biosynthesis protein MetW